MKLAGRTMVDTAPLRESPAYRRIWAGNGLSSIGGQMTQYAVLLQVFLLTRSSLSVGLVGLAAAIPVVVVSLAGGAVVDALDRRTTVLAATSVQVVVSGALAALAFAHLNRVWLLYVLVAIEAAVSAVNAPARRTFMPMLLRREQLPAGAALQMFTMHGSITIGPALAGLLTAAWGLKACYLVDALSFGFALYGVARLPPMRPSGGGTRPGLRAVAEGLRFVAGTRVILGAFVADMSATVLGMPIALFPAINAQRFGGSPETLGLLTTALAVGGMLGSALSGPAGRVNRQGLGMLGAAGVWGAGLVGFGLSGVFGLALLALAVAGAGDATAVVLRTALVQGVTQDELRGRVSAAEFATGAGVPQLGNFRAGAVASLSSPGVSAVTGGIAVLAGAAAVGMSIPALAAFRARPSPQSGSTQPANAPVSH